MPGIRLEPFSEYLVFDLSTTITSIIESYRNPEKIDEIDVKDHHSECMELLKRHRWGRLRTCDGCHLRWNQSLHDNFCLNCYVGLVSYGKYRNRSMRWVFENDKSYCQWVIKSVRGRYREIWNEAAFEFAEWIERETFRRKSYYEKMLEVVREMSNDVDR